MGLFNRAVDSCTTSSTACPHPQSHKTTMRDNTSPPTHPQSQTLRPTTNITLNKIVNSILLLCLKSYYCSSTRLPPVPVCTRFSLQHAPKSVNCKFTFWMKPCSAKVSILLPPTSILERFIDFFVY